MIFGNGLMTDAFQNCKTNSRAGASTGNHHLQWNDAEKALRAARRSVTAPLCCRLMEGANLVLSRAPLLELIVRLVGVHDVQAESVGALDGGVHRHSLGNVAQGVSVQHQA